MIKYLRSNLHKSLMICTILFFALSANESRAGESLEIGFIVGASIPNEDFDKVFDESKRKLLQDGLKENDSLSFTDVATQSGFNLSAKVRVGLTSKFKLIFGAGFHRFPGAEMEFKDPLTNEVYATFSKVTTVIPFSAGANFYFLDLNLVKIYGNAELTYNYTMTTTDYKLDNGISIPTALLDDDKDIIDESTGRIGANAGIGFDIDLKLVQLNLEGKFNMANLLGKDELEDAKNYITVGIGVYF